VGENDEFDGRDRETVQGLEAGQAETSSSSCTTATGGRERPGPSERVEACGKRVYTTRQSDAIDETGMRDK